MNGTDKSPSGIGDRVEGATAAKTYLVVHGEVEISPGRFTAGIVESSGHPSREAAEGRWRYLVSQGFYEEPWERPEYRTAALTLDEALPGMAA